MGERFTPYRHVFLGPRGLNHWKCDSADAPGVEPDASGLKNGWTTGGHEPAQRAVHGHMVVHTFLSLRRGYRRRRIRFGFPFPRGGGRHIMQANATRSPSADGARNNKTENVRHQTCSPCGPSGSPFRWKAAEVVTGEDSSGSASETRVDPIGVSGDGLEPVHHLLTFFPHFPPTDNPRTRHSCALESWSGGGPGSRATRTELSLTKRRLSYFHGWQKVCRVKAPLGLSPPPCRAIERISAARRTSHMR